MTAVVTMGRSERGTQLGGRFGVGCTVSVGADAAKERNVGSAKELDDKCHKISKLIVTTTCLLIVELVSIDLSSASRGAWIGNRDSKC